MKQNTICNYLQEDIGAYLSGAYLSSANLSENIHQPTNPKADS